ncbi:hypothetical protein BGX28_001535, partial [Mortierella sp. GBA30]
DLKDDVLQNIHQLSKHSSTLDTAMISVGITLNIRCVFDGDRSSDGFIVEASTEDTVAGLKDLVLWHHSLDWNAPTESLQLWMVSIETDGAVVSFEGLCRNQGVPPIKLRETTNLGHLFPYGVDKDRIRILLWLPKLF